MPPNGTMRASCGGYTSLRSSQRLRGGRGVTEGWLRGGRGVAWEGAGQQEVPTVDATLNI
jgi:hypothetical protein